MTKSKMGNRYAPEVRVHAVHYWTPKGLQGRGCCRTAKLVVLSSERNNPSKGGKLRDQGLGC